MNTILSRSFGLLFLLLAAALPGMAQLTIGDATFPTATRTGAYGPIQLTASAPGGIIYTWQLEAAAGPLPAGMTLSFDGVISAANVTEAAGTYPFVVRATCSSGCVGTPTNTRAFSITVVNPPTFSANIAALPAGVSNVPYSQNLSSAFTPSGGVSPYTYSVFITEGSDLVGLTFSSPLLLSGAPQLSAGTYQIVFRLTDANGVRAPNDISLPITLTSQPATLSPSQLPNWTIGRPYFREITAATGVGAYTYQFSGNLSSVGLQSDAKLACPSEALFRFGTFYSSPLNVTGGPGGPVLFSASGLPSGFGINSSTGVVFGFSDEQLNLQIQYSAQFANGLKVGRTCALQASFAGPNTISSGCPLNFAVVGSPYFSAIPLIGYNDSPAFDIPANTLPPGLTLNTSTGAITGTPTQAGLFNFISAWAANNNTASGNSNCSIRVYTPSTPVQGGSFVYGVPTATGSVNLAVSLQNQSPSPTQNYNFTINPAPAIAPFTYPNAQLGASYSSNLLSTNLSGGTPSFTYSLASPSGPLPPGLSLQSDGTISGTPSQLGTYSINLQVTDIAGAVALAGRQIVVTSALTVSPNTLNAGVVNIPYSVTLTGAGGSGSPFTFANPGGGLPPGLTLASNGTLSGTPTQAGTFTFNVQMTDSASSSTTVQRQIVVSGGLTVSPTSLTGGAVNVPYSVTLTGSGGSGSPYTFANPGGGLPPGLALASNGTLSGTPTQAGTFSFNVQLNDSVGVSITVQRQIAISTGLSLSPSVLNLGAQDVPYAATFTANGGSGGGYAFTLADGSLPPGLILASGGALSGTPTETGTYNFTVRVADSQSNSTVRSYNLQIVSFTCPVALVPLNLAYSSSLSLSGLQVASYSVNSGGLPPGLQLNPSGGSITGTATTEGLFTPTFTATDIQSRSVSRSCPLNVSNTLLLRSPRTTARLSQRYVSSVSVIGGRAPFFFQLVGGALPEGLSLESTTGRITGTPTSLATSNFEVLVTDSEGRKLQRPFAIFVLPRLGTFNVRCPMPSALLDSGYLSNGSMNTNLTLRFTALGSLPPGLSMVQATGQFSGIPTKTGTYNFELIAETPSSPNVEFGRAQCSIQVAESIAPLRLACNDQEDLVVGESYASPAISVGGVAPITTQLEESVLPPGLSLNTTNGLISGVPTVAGTYNYFLRARDAVNANSGASCSVSVAPPAAISIITTSLPVGETDSNYSAQLTATGGTPPLTWSVLNGNLPNGLSLNSSTGLISGTLRGNGQFVFNIGVRDAQQQSASRLFSLSVNAPVQPLFISTRTLSFGTVGVPYQTQVGAGGGNPGYTFTLAGGALPPGLSLAPNGSISGTPTTVGAQFAFTVRVVDRSGASAEAAYTVTIFPGDLRLSCPSAPAEVGAFYEAPALVLGGASPYSFSLAQGSLPAGLELSSSSGLVSGRPTSAGLASFTLAVTDSRQSRTQTLCSINVRAGLLRITSDDTFRGVAGIAYTGSVEAAGGQGPYTFTIPPGSLPPGLTFASNGSITGTPSKIGRYPFTAEVRDALGTTARKSFTFSVAASNLSLACPANLSPAYSFPYADAFSTTGGVAPITFSLDSGTLPPGLNPAGSANSSGLIALSGTPTLPGEFLASLRASDASDTTVTISCRFLVTGELLQITTTTLGEGRQFAAYSEGLSARGGVGAYRWSISGGSLPEGLQLDPASGSIGGRPLRDGTFGFSAQVTDSRNNRASRGFEIIVTPGELPLLITTASPLSDANVGRPYSASISVEGGKPPYVLSAEGLPEGFSFAGGSLSGTPQSPGSADFSVTARDANNETTSKGFSFRIKGQGTLRILSANVPDGVEGESYTGGFTAEGGTAPLRWSIVSGGVPPGVVFDSATGRLSGRPTLSGPFNLTVDVSDAGGDSARAGVDYSIRPAGVTALEITTATLPDANIGAPYSLTLGARGGREPYSWSFQGDLLEGLSSNASGQISGTAQRVGTTTFTATVRDALGFRASRSFTLRAAAGAPPALLIEGLPDTTNPNQTLPFTLRLASPFAVAVRGRLTLVFVPDSIHNADDNAVRFGNATRSIDFTIAANSTQIVVPAGALSVASGTLAGTIRVDSSLEFGGVTAAGPSRSITLGRRPPVISNLRLTRTGSTLELRIEGFTPSRRLNEARVTLTPAAGVDLAGNAQLTINVQAAINAWFASSAASQFGGQFALVLPFTVNGDAANITSVSVVIVNDDGTSNTATAN
jgi:large repetitive protein